jgi:hypothetical protein
MQNEAEVGHDDAADRNVVTKGCLETDVGDGEETRRLVRAA